MIELGLEGKERKGWLVKEGNDSKERIVKKGRQGNGVKDTKKGCNGKEELPYKELGWPG